MQPCVKPPPFPTSRQLLKGLGKLLLSLFALTIFTARIPAGELSWKPLAPLPDSHGFAGPYAGVSSDALIVAGGANFPDGYPWNGGKKTYHDRIFVLDAPDKTWRVAEEKLPAPIGYGVSITVPSRNSILCIGGNDATSARSEVFELIKHPDKIEIRHTLPPLPVASTMGTGALLADTVYFIGGETSGVTHRRAFCLNLSASTPAWAELPWPVEAPGRILAVASVSGGKLLVFSGCDLGASTWDQRTYLQDAWSFSPEKNAWTRLSDLPQSAAAAPNLAFTDHSGRLLIFGGSNRAFVDAQRAARPATNGNGLDHPGFPADILAYDPTADAWSRVGSVPRPAPVTTTAVRWRDRLVLPTGEIKPGIRSPQILTVTAQP